MDHDDVHATATRFPAPETANPASGRRGVIKRGLLAAAAALGAGPALAGAKKKRKKKKRDASLKLADWYGTWSTRLSNGVQGTATFTKDVTGGCCDGTYSNSVGSGVFRCYPDPGGKQTDLGCRYEQTEGPPVEGDFFIDLTDKNHWEGSHRSDSGDSGTWSGVRR
jgi:hypothetical protein